MVLRPALPYVPAAGTENAAALKNPVEEARLWPVALARSLQVPLVWARIVAVLPSTHAVSGVPVSAVSEPLSCQSLRARTVQPLGVKRVPAVPTCDVSTQLAVNVCRRSKL